MFRSLATRAQALRPLVGQASVYRPVAAVVGSDTLTCAWFGQETTKVAQKRWLWGKSSEDSSVKEGDSNANDGATVDAAYTVTDVEVDEFDEDAEYGGEGAYNDIVTAWFTKRTIKGSDAKLNTLAKQVRGTLSLCCYLCAFFVRGVAVFIRWNQPTFIVYIVALS